MSIIAASLYRNGKRIGPVSLDQPVRCATDRSEMAEGAGDTSGHAFPHCPARCALIVEFGNRIDRQEGREGREGRGWET